MNSAPKPVEKANIFEKKTTINVDYNALERLIHEKYPEIKGYEIAPHEELNNYSSKKYWAEKKNFNQKKWDTLVAKNGNQEYSLPLIMAKLAVDGYIDEGEYVVDVYW